MEYFFIHKTGDEVVGYIDAVEEGPRRLQIAVFRLALQWYHTSIPSRLLGDVHDFCCRQGISTVVFDVSATPPVAMRILEQCGFRPMGSQARRRRSTLECRVSGRIKPSPRSSLSSLSKRAFPC